MPAVYACALNKQHWTACCRFVPWGTLDNNEGNCEMRDVLRLQFIAMMRASRTCS